jgi:hypothetical protein
MAKKLDGFDFSRPKENKSKYPWPEWLDGSVWELHNGEDFEGVESRHFASTIYNAARARGKKCRVAVRDSGDTIILQAFKPGD